jgi:hypothetical protein
MTSVTTAMVGTPLFVLRGFDNDDIWMTLMDDDDDNDANDCLKRSYLIRVGLESIFFVMFVGLVLAAKERLEE